MPQDWNYGGDHSITFGAGTFSVNGKLQGKNTWNDWYLIPDRRPDVTEASFETKMVEIPGRPGSLDNSEWILGRPIYQPRSGSWDFIVDNSRPDWITLRDQIISFLHGKRMKCVLEDDPNYYYEGRFQVQWKSGETNSAVSIGYSLTPYKKHWNPTGDWLWDPFCFETDRTDQAVAQKL